MQKLNAIVHQDAQLQEFHRHWREKSTLQQLWLSSAPIDLASKSLAIQLQDGILTIATPHAMVASKIKMLHDTLLKALTNASHNNHRFSRCKVTAIKVKVQVHSGPPPSARRIIPIGASSAQHLRQFADAMAGTPLGEAIKKLASNQT